MSADHPSDLTLERRLGDDLDAEARSQVEAHLDACGACRARWQALLADEALALPARRRPARPRRVQWLIGGVGVGLLAAAIALVALRHEPPGRFVTKGGGLVLELWAHDGEEPRLLDWDDEVFASERLGFRVQLDEPAHLMIVGVDDRGSTYLGYPQDRDEAAAWLEPSDEPVTLPAGLRFDPSPGHEHVVAIACPGPFAFAPVADRLRELAGPEPWTVEEALVDESCDQLEVRLQKGEEAP